MAQSEPSHNTWWEMVRCVCAHVCQVHTAADLSDVALRAHASPDHCVTMCQPYYRKQRQSHAVSSLGFNSVTETSCRRWLLRNSSDAGRDIDKPFVPCLELMPEPLNNSAVPSPHRFSPPCSGTPTGERLKVLLFVVHRLMDDTLTRK